MKKLLMLTAAGGILLALAGPTLAAQRVHRGADAYASGAVATDRSGSYYYGPRDGQGRAISVPSNAYGSAAPSYSNGSYGGNLPFADRPYGDPDTW